MRRWGRAVSTALAGILVTAPWYYGGYPDFARYGITALVLLATALWLWTRPPLESRLVVPIIALLSWPLAQAAFRISASPVETLESVVVLGGSLAMFAFFATQTRDKQTATRAAGLLLVLCLAQAIFGIVQHGADPRRLYGLALEVMTSPYGSYYNHNHFAGLIEMGALLAAGFALGTAKRAGTIDPPTLVLGGVSLALAGAVAASRSRGGALALVGGSLALIPLWLWAQRGRRARRGAMWAAITVGALVVGFGVLAIPAQTRAHLATLLSGPSGPGDSSGQYRVATYQATLALAGHHPLLGAGLGTFKDSVSAFRRGHGSIHALHADSDVIEFTAEAGLVGLILLAWVVYAGLQGFGDRAMEGHDPLRKGIAAGALAAVVALFIHSFVDFNLRLPANALVFSAMAGLASAARTPGRIFPWPRALALVAALLALLSGWRVAGALELARSSNVGNPHEKLAAVSVALRWHPYMAPLWLIRAVTWAELAEGDPVVKRFRLERAVADAERCVALRPTWPEAWLNLGWIRLKLEDRVAARAAMDRVATLDPSRISLGLARAEFFSRIGDPDAVVRELIRIRTYNDAEWPSASARDAGRRLGLDPERLAQAGEDLK
jgi:O-antigen ligase